MKKFIKDLADKLDECPFCKGHNLDHAIYMSGGVIECKDCGSIGPEVDPDYDIEKAIKAWNNRKGKS